MALAFMVLAAAVPLTFLAGGAPLGIMLGNGAGFPGIFLGVMVLLLLFSAGFTTMSRFLAKPGAFFTYVAHGLGPAWGVGTAYLALVVYSAVNIGVHALTGFILSITLASLGGPEVAWWLCSLVSIAIVGFLGYQRIDIGSSVLAILLIGEITIMTAIIVAVILTSAHGAGLSFEPFTPKMIFSGNLGVGLTMAMSAFIGFEAVAVFRDEAHLPERTVPRATYLAVVGIGCFYALATWAIVMAWGGGAVVAVVAADPGAFLLKTASTYLGVVGETVLNILLITSLFACTLSLHNIITRYQHSIAYAGLVARWMAALHPRHRSPWLSSLFQTGTAAVLIVLCAVLHLDPLLQIIAWTSGIATLGVAVLMTLTSIAVIAFFARDHRGISVWKRVIAPLLALIGLVVVVVAMTMNFPILIGEVGKNGEPVFSIVSDILILLTFVPLVLGTLHVAMLRGAKASTYQKFLADFSG